MSEQVAQIHPNGGITYPKQEGDFPLMNEYGEQVGIARVRWQAYVAGNRIPGNQEDISFYQAWFDYFDEDDAS